MRLRLSDETIVQWAVMLMIVGAVLYGAVVLSPSADAADTPAFTNDAEGEDARAYWRDARRGDAEAQLWLATAYWAGVGIEKDRCEALKWMRKAGKQGLPLAQAGVVILFLYRQCGWKDDERFVRAYAWFTDDVVTMFTPAQAKTWLTQYGFAENGIESMAGLREFIREQLTPGETARALKLRKKLID